MNSVLDSIESTGVYIFNMLSLTFPEIKRMIFNGHTTIIVLVSAAIMLSIVTIIRQQKILKMLRDLTPPREEKASAKETE